MWGHQGPRALNGGGAVMYVHVHCLWGRWSYAQHLCTTWVLPVQRLYTVAVIVRTRRGACVAGGVPVWPEGRGVLYQRMYVGAWLVG